MRREFRRESFGFKLLRALYALAVISAACTLQPREAHADYPERTIKIVVPFAPGGGTDLIARTLAEAMANDLQQSVIIENKAGAGTILGTAAVASSAPDGYTL